MPITPTTPGTVPPTTTLGKLAVGQAALKAIVDEEKNQAGDDQEKNQDVDVASVLGKVEAKNMTRLEAAVAKNKLDPNLYQTFLSRGLATPADKKAYDKATSNQAKNDLRMKWAKDTLEANKQKLSESGRIWTKEFQRVDTTWGQYLSYGAVCEKYGIVADPDGAIGAGTKYCTKAAKMGGKWSAYDPMGEIPLFLFLNIKYREHLKEMWQMYKKDMAENSGSAPKLGRIVGGAPAAAEVAYKPPDAPPVALPAKPIAALPSGTVTPGTDDDPPANETGVGKLRTPKHSEQMGRALKLKTTRGLVLMKARYMVKMIQTQSDEGWSRMSDETNLGTLVKMVDSNDNEDLEIECFLVDPNFKKKAEHDIARILDKFLLCEPGIKKLEKYCEDMQTFHDSIMKDRTSKGGNARVKVKGKAKTGRRGKRDAVAEDGN